MTTFAEALQQALQLVQQGDLSAAANKSGQQKGQQNTTKGQSLCLTFFNIKSHLRICTVCIPF
jgi:hypothetical protein